MKMLEVQKFFNDPLRSPLYEGITRFIEDPFVRGIPLVEVDPSKSLKMVDGYFALFPKRDEHLSAFLDLGSKHAMLEIYNWILNLKVPEAGGKSPADDKGNTNVLENLFFWGKKPDIVLAFGSAGNARVSNPSLYVASTLLPEEGLDIAQKIVSQRILSLNKGL